VNHHEPAVALVSTVIDINSGDYCRIRVGVAAQAAFCHPICLSLVREAMPKYSHWRRHLPFALLLLGLLSLIMAMSRPIAEVEVPINQATVILAMDISGSMCSADIPPNRLTVAQHPAISVLVPKCY
jgi:hypothetical protein